MPFRNSPQGVTVCRDPRTKLIRKLEAAGVAANAPAAIQLVDKYFSCVEYEGSYNRWKLRVKDMAGKMVCPCRHSQLQQLGRLMICLVTLQPRLANGKGVRYISSAVEWVLEQVRLIHVTLLSRPMTQQSLALGRCPAEAVCCCANLQVFAAKLSA